jgi:hypothetical protein
MREPEIPAGPDELSALTEALRDSVRRTHGSNNIGYAMTELESEFGARMNQLPLDEADAPDPYYGGTLLKYYDLLTSEPSDMHVPLVRDVPELDTHRESLAGLVDGIDWILQQRLAPSMEYRSHDELRFALGNAADAARTMQGTLNTLSYLGEDLRNDPTNAELVRTVQAEYETLWTAFEALEDAVYEAHVTVPAPHDTQAEVDEKQEAFYREADQHLEYDEETQSIVDTRWNETTDSSTDAGTDSDDEEADDEDDDDGLDSLFG